MADEEKPARKSRREVLYNAKPKAEAKPAEEKKPAAAESGPARDHAEMMRRHENERRDMHGQHRAQHREIDGEGGGNMAHRKMALHRRHEKERADMHERHEKELIDKLSAMHEGAPAAQAA